MTTRSTDPKAGSRPRAARRIRTRPPRVDEAVVISLPQRGDRLKRMRAHWPNPWPFPNPVIVAGVQAEPPAWFHSSKGAYGCQQAHLNVLRSAWERSVDTTLVLEDDAVFVPDFAARWERLAPSIPDNWSMIMLGGQHIQAPEPVTTEVVRCIETRRTHAYIIHLRAVPALMRTWATSSRHIDHALVDFQAQAKVYAPVRFLAGQGAGLSDISGRSNDERYWTEGVSEVS